MAAPNIVNVTTITGKTAVANVTTVTSNVIVNAASSGQVYKVNTIMVSNIDGTNDATVSVSVLRGAPYFLASTINIPADSTMVLVDKNGAFYLEEGDAINTVGSANDDLQILCSYEIIS